MASVLAFFQKIHSTRWLWIPFYAAIIALVFYTYGKVS